jgi:hypothetical protein
MIQRSTSAIFIRFPNPCFKLVVLKESIFLFLYPLQGLGRDSDQPACQMLFSSQMSVVFSIDVYFGLSQKTIMGTWDYRKTFCDIINDYRTPKIPLFVRGTFIL